MIDTTILIPTYNRGHLIHETIESCYGQTYKNFKIVVYDDGSNDQTLKVLSKYKDVTVIRGKENRGIGYARNVLINSLDTKYGVWLDSDDKMHPQRLEKCVNFMEQNEDVQIVYSFIKIFPTNKEIKIDVSKYDKNDFQSLKYNTSCATAFFRKRLKKYQFYDLRYGSEDVLWLWSMIRNDEKVAQISENLYLYRRHEGRLSNLKLKKVKEKSIEDEKIGRILKNDF